MHANANVDRLIAQRPQGADAKEVKVDPLGGLTNINYRVTVEGERYVLRLSGHDSVRLGINREAELEALTLAAAFKGFDYLDYAQATFGVMRGAFGRGLSAGHLQPDSAIVRKSSSK